MYEAKTMPKEGSQAFNSIWVRGDLIHSGGKTYIHPVANQVNVDGEIGQRIIMHEVLPETVTRLETGMPKADTITATDIIRRVDDLGRIVIPKEIRHRYGIKDSTPMQFFPTKDGICLKVYRRGDDIRSIIQTAKSIIYDYADDISDDEYDRILQEAENLCQFVKSKKKGN